MNSQVIVFFITFPLSGFGFQAFDCVSNPSATSVFDLQSIEECESFESWYSKVEDTEIQVIKSKEFQEMEVYECKVTETHIATLCGQTESIAYGVPTDLKTLKPYLLSPRECQNLIEENSIVYDGKFFEVESISHFSFDKMVSGTRTVDGDCEYGEPFTHRGKYYDQHTVRAIVQGSVTKRLIKYDPVLKSLKIDGVKVKTSDNQHENNRATFVWEDRPHDCKEQIVEVYRGPAKKYYPSKPGSQPVMVVSVPNQETYFGLKIQEQDIVCDNFALTTQIPGIHLIEKSGFINAKPLQFSDVNLHDEMIALLGYNYVVRSEEFTSALRAVSEKLCEVERKSLHNQLNLLKQNSDVGITELVQGEGFTGVRRGRVVYIVACSPVEVELRNMVEDTEDIPVWYDQQPMFADAFTFNLKPNSSIHIQNDDMPVMWKIDNIWYCKIGERASPCLPPETISVNMTSVKEALKQKVETAYNGGLTTKENRLIHKRTVFERNTIDTKLNEMGHDFSESNRDIFDKKLSEHYGFKDLIIGYYDELISSNIFDNIVHNFQIFWWTLSGIYIFAWLYASFQRVKLCYKKKFGLKMKIWAILAPGVFWSHVWMKENFDVEKQNPRAPMAVIPFYNNEFVLQSENASSLN